jgi:hypothetical protein
MERTTRNELNPLDDSGVALDDKGLIDQTPPPDHEGWLEACENGWRMTRERRERRRREPKAR